MEIILWIAGLIFAILQIILFFKLWGMTDNVAEIKQMLKQQHNENKCNSKTTNTQAKETPINQFEGKSIKLRKSGKPVVVESYEVDLDKFVVYDTKGIFQGRYSKDELLVDEDVK